MKNWLEDVSKVKGLHKRYCMKRFYGKMMAIVRRYIKDHEDAMEVLNTSFLKVSIISTAIKDREAWEVGSQKS